MKGKRGGEKSGEKSRGRAMVSPPSLSKHSRETRGACQSTCTHFHKVIGEVGIVSNHTKSGFVSLYTSKTNNIYI
jgi:hypothetical protein